IDFMALPAEFRRKSRHAADQGGRDMVPSEKRRLASLWDDKKASGMSEAERLVYRSNLLGSDKRVTNFGGGNTSSKIMQKDPLTGHEVEVLWVKGSGGDVGTIKLDGFSTLYMDKLRA